MKILLGKSTGREIQTVLLLSTLYFALFYVYSRISPRFHEQFNDTMVGPMADTVIGLSNGISFRLLLHALSKVHVRTSNMP